MARRRKHLISFSHFIFCAQKERPINWNKEFGRKAPLNVEIGSGLGEFFIGEAIRHPDRNFVGIELEWERVKKFLQKIESKKGTLGEKGPCSNVRVLKVDAVVAFERLFAPKTIHNIYCLFPCPWPKKKHIKHRLFSYDFLRLLNSRLIDKGEIKIVTDSRPYYEWILENFDDTGFRKEENIIQPKFNTKFERKWCAQGQREFFELHLIKNRHIAVALKKDVSLKVYFAKGFDAEKFSLDDIKGDTAIIFKDFIFDPLRKKGLVYVIVGEKSIVQSLRISVSKRPKGWRVAQAEGDMSLPTPGVALAIEHVYKAVIRTTKT
jgi:tRNA (guanine-N7-)-methyltransferase